jgi:dCMP deaminase
MKEVLAQQPEPGSADRPSWDEYFIAITRAVATRATCSRRSVGAVIVKDKRILATGYNGAPVGMRHCNHEDGADMRNGHCTRSTHAEQNAIVQAARYGIPIAGGSMYCTDSPCLTCAKLAINAGLVRIVYEDAYPDELAAQMLFEAGVKVDRMGGSAA